MSITPDTRLPKDEALEYLRERVEILTHALTVARRRIWQLELEISRSSASDSEVTAGTDRD